MNRTLAAVAIGAALALTAPSAAAAAELTPPTRTATVRTLPAPHTDGPTSTKTARCFKANRGRFHGHDWSKMRKARHGFRCSAWTEVSR